jgi:hypothetical protein
MAQPLTGSEKSSWKDPEAGNGVRGPPVGMMAVGEIGVDGDTGDAVAGDADPRTDAGGWDPG